MATNKQILEEILEQNKELARKQFEISLQFSDYQNKQELFNQKINDLLETNPLTKRMGFIEKAELNEARIIALETKNKVTAGKIFVAVTILSAIGGIIWKLLSIFDKH